MVTGGIGASITRSTTGTATRTSAVASMSATSMRTSRADAVARRSVETDVAINSGSCREDTNDSLRRLYKMEQRFNTSLEPSTLAIARQHESTWHRTRKRP